MRLLNENHWVFIIPFVGVSPFLRGQRLVGRTNDLDLGNSVVAKLQ